MYIALCFQKQPSSFRSLDGHPPSANSAQPTPVLTSAFSPTSHGGPATSSQSKLAKLDSVLDRPPAIPRKTLTAILLCAVAMEEMDSVLV